MVDSRQSSMMSDPVEVCPPYEEQLSSRDFIRQENMNNNLYREGHVVQSKRHATICVINEEDIESAMSSPGLQITQNQTSEV